MLFNSFEFIVFLPIVFLLYWYVFSKRLKLQNAFLVAVSYLFYGWLDWRFLCLIILTSVATYYSGIYIEKYNNERAVQRWISMSNIVLNILILCAFKYFNFFAENVSRLFSLFGVQMDWVTLDILLPVGISFYTFTALSYSIDVYQNKIKAVDDITAVFAYIAFFPQLLAGPIARATHLMPQFCRLKRFDYEQAVDGLRQTLWGLFKKVVIADKAAIMVAPIFDSYQDMSGSTLLLGAFYFTLQIYGDFSGYSDMAIGIARLFGINLLQNFNLPYFSRDIAEFWRKWHISLNTWFRDYIYIPLGGSRAGKWITVRNTMVIFLISGLWHGANWTFIAWGMFHGLLFLPNILTGRNKRYKGIPSESRIFPSFHELRGMLTTFLFVMFGWIFFRADSIHQALGYISGIFSFSILTKPEYLSWSYLFFVFAMFVVEWFSRDGMYGFNIKNVRSACVRRFCYLLILFVVFVWGGQQAGFIYFKF
ncbi:MBOAT family O-acyltransferase [Coprobacter sp.]